MAEVQVNDHLLVRRHEQIPVDGVLVSRGSFFLDEAQLTGESQPVVKKYRDYLLAGTVNQSESLVMVCRQSFADSALTQLVEKVATIKAQKTPINKIVNRISAFFTPLVIILALIAFIVQLFYGYQIHQAIPILA